MWCHRQALKHRIAGCGEWIFIIRGDDRENTCGGAYIGSRGTELNLPQCLTIESDIGRSLSFQGSGGGIKFTVNAELDCKR